MTEQEDHRYIKKQAMDLRISKRVVADNIIKTYRSFPVTIKKRAASRRFSGIARDRPFFLCRMRCV